MGATLVEGAMGSVAWGPASFLGLAYSHRPITQSKNRAAFVESGEKRSWTLLV